jgi:hypothetical protein
MICLYEPGPWVKYCFQKPEQLFFVIKYDSRHDLDVMHIQNVGPGMMIQSHQILTKHRRL